MAKFVAIYGSAMLIASVLAGLVAAMKRRDVSYWMTMSFLFPPAIVMLLLMAKNTGPRPRRESFEAEERRELRREDSDRIL
jgi:Na+/melibiose symporter-like transporter